jgi:hypothetical protein
LHQQELLVSLKPHLEFFLNLYTDCNSRFNIFSNQVKYVFLREIRELVLKPLIRNHPYVQHCLKNVVHNNKEIDIIEGNLSFETALLKVNYAQFESDNNVEYDDVINEINKYVVFLQKYEYYEEALNNELLGIKDNMTRTLGYKSFVKTYKYILADQEKLFYIKNLCYNKDS